MRPQWTVIPLLWCLTAAADEKPAFIFPVDCQYGVDCFIQFYFDHDPTPGYSDYKCRQQTYDGHTGTDIRLVNLPQMAAGVKVIAAASGTVFATRDGVADTYLDPARFKAINKIGLGNAVVIQHEDGWRTTYGHMKNGSLMVQKGDQVKQGQSLGEIGLSGLTEFPHMHFQVRHHGKLIDPFIGKPDRTKCGDTGSSQWLETADNNITYFPGLLLDYGFNNKPPVDYRSIETGYFNKGADSRSEYLFFWVRFIGLTVGDQATLSFIAPNGELIEEQTFPALKRNKEQQLYYIGIDNPAIYPGQTGRWQGRVRLQRTSLPAIDKQFDYTAEASERR
ncbi:M23 family metallopeptidase [Endozoicomonas montiporae]|uniref:M23 family metallopeptidase n=1 Tax=Endozoicomonas montiporae TaxID=1027273 RepID=UPI00068A3EFE|nr:M23 family metallopeptidase [Endozoicomonas montiporae]